MKIVTGKQMQALDRRTIDGGVSGELLMERAGIGAFEALLEFIEPLPYVHRHRVVVINGKGNNGGDGFITARLLADAGLEVAVVLAGEPQHLINVGGLARSADGGQRAGQESRRVAEGHAYPLFADVEG